MYDDWKTVQAKWQSARETDKRKVLAFVVLGNKGGQESLNHPDVRQKFSSSSLTKSFDGLFFTKTFLPPKLKRIISSNHFHIADRLEKAYCSITLHHNIHENSYTKHRTPTKILM